ncbi:MAG: DNA-formamidopyrimidine glycosylase [Planctomycetes bacterium SCN 63-9]|mgnify:CR=1 FL=1|nr:MAG: DNA-formamidopyrimidine glycosylase [Planctomycetes bacterium SCN 63-9]
MPELPEVETMVRGIRPALEDRVLRRIEVLDARMIQGCEAEELERRGRDATVAGVDRRGKWVVLTLAGTAGIIVIQPRMTGGFWLVPPDRPQHIRLTFHVDGPLPTIWFCDTRRLGKIIWFPNAEAAAQAFAASHGPDALTISRSELADRLSRTGRGIKPTLMDQKIVAGIGNIYADEVLFQARIHPERIASGLKKAELDRLHRAIPRILQAAIDAEGSSFDAGYRTVLGLEGGFLDQNSMYGRAGKPCPGCSTPIQKTKIAGLIGRPTYYCVKCQPKG